jgi:hypothetical protein
MIRLAHPHAERPHDAYWTPPEVVTALLKCETLPQYLWEPCCGNGAIVNVLRDRGYDVTASDLVDYGGAIDLPVEYGVDFLKTTHAPRHCGCVITNPPFRLAAAFIEHTLKLVPIGIFLLRLSFLESERRRGILDTGLLHRVHIFRNRLPMLHRHGWQGPHARSQVAYGWFVFCRSHRGPIMVDRISWEK